MEEEMELNNVYLKIVGNKNQATCVVGNAKGEPVTFNAWGRNGAEAANKITKEIRKDMGKGIRLSFAAHGSSWTT